MIGYLGPQGTFSHLAALEYFGEKAQLTPYPSIHALIMAADSQEIRCAIVPMENSIEGSINMTLDTLVFEANLYITGEHVLRVCENLMARPGVQESEITKIISHPQPIAQCSRLINSVFSDTVIEYAESTGNAAQFIAASEEKYAVIGPESLAGLYGLEVLRANCGDEPNNSTRFVVVEKQKCANIGCCGKTSIALMLENRPGSLFGTLEIFAKNNVNMTRIESRPSKKELGKYVFFIDIDGCAEDAVVAAALDKVRAETEFFKFLGSYGAAGGQRKI